MTTTPIVQASGVSLEEVVSLLGLADRGGDVFEGGHTRMSAEVRHVFGGMVAAQAYVAAARTMSPDRSVHSLHNYFLRPGDPDVPVELHVERTRDGRAFSHRKVSAVQHGRAIAELSCSFAEPLPGVHHQLPAPTPSTAAPDVAPDRERLAGTPGVHPVALAPDAFELRSPDLEDDLAGRLTPPGQGVPMWLRAAGTLPADPVLHTALLVYATDISILRPVMGPHPYSTYSSDVRAASIDHAVWFHREVRVDDWLLMVADSTWAGHGRALARASLYDGAGELVAQVAQEALMRVPGLSEER